MRAGSRYPTVETYRQRKDGSLVDVELSAAPVRDSAGRVVSHMVVFSDITKRKRQQRELRASRARIVQAADTERRRLERNLHDGAQQRLVGFLRDLRGHVRRDQHDALGAIIRQIFTAADGDEARRRLRDAVEQLERRLPKLAALLEDAEADVLAFYAFPAEHWPKIRSTNPLERFNREIARRTDVVGIFPDDASLIRLVSMLAIEANDEWLVGRSYISQKSMATLSDRVSEKDLSLDQDKEVELIAA